MRASHSLGGFSFFVVVAFAFGSVEIKCSFENYYSGEINSQYSCKVEAITRMEDPTFVTEISGLHMEAKTDADVKVFYISNQNDLNVIPYGISRFLPNLEHFEWRWGNLSAINSSTFEPYPNLLHIDLAGNKLVTLDLFKHTRRLQFVDFSNNLLEHVGYDFSNLCKY